MNVWVLDFSAEGPEGGDYTGCQAVHESKTGAMGHLAYWLEEFGIDAWEMSADMVVSSATADDGSESADLLVNGTKISYGVHLMPVEP